VSSFSPTFRHRTLLFLFFFSGFAALLYQVVWQRWLVFYTGIGSVSISLIVSAYMVGLGSGYLVGGFLSDRSTLSKTILFFVLAESGIGLFALCSKPFLYDFLYASGFLSFGNSFLQTYFILFLSLLFPTFLMGLSLPFLTKAFRLKTVTDQVDFLNLLYFVNTFGAATGALVSGIVLMQLLGMEKTIYLGAAINFSCALCAFLIYKKEKKDRSVAVQATEPSLPFIWNRSFLFWACQYFISGFAALSLEILWFRILDVSIKSLSITFSILLAIYLLSMALGTLTGVRFSRRHNKNNARLFLFAQYSIYVFTIGSIALLLWSINSLGPFAFISDYFRSYDLRLEPESLPVIISVYLVIPVFLMSMPTFLMGFSFSISQKLIQDSFREIGRKIGFLQAINILGSTLGTWFATFIGFKYLGTSLTIKLVCLLSVFYLFLLIYKKYVGFKLYFPLLLICFIGIAFLPRNNIFWQIFSGIHDKSEIVFNEDETAVSSIICAKNSNCNVHYVIANGLGQSDLPLPSDMIHVLIGSIPALIHKNPQHIAVIGLGSGGTLYGISSRPAIQSIDCFEVITNQPKTLLEYAHRYNDKNIIKLLNDDRISFILKDGRYAISKSSKKYDLIEADALRPLSSYSGNIYSKEYFHRLMANLNKNGIVATWVPTSRVRRTFCSVFPFVFEIKDLLLLGSNEPFTVDLDSIDQNLNAPYTRNHFKFASLPIKDALEPFLENIVQLQAGTISRDIDINTDMFPRDEYAYFSKLIQKIDGSSDGH
jgi:spermidine synthase